MKEHKIGIHEAKSMLAGILSQFEQEYQTRRREYETTRGPIPMEVTKYLDTAEFVSSGTFYFSSFATRYHRKQNDFTPGRQQPGAEQYPSLPENGDNISSNTKETNSTPVNPVPLALNDAASDHKAQKINGLQLSGADQFTERNYNKPSDKVRS